MNSGFDRLAAPYRWMEYLSFGKALERCRFRFVSDLTSTRTALLLGDGDGRFAKRLLQIAPHAEVHAVDSSAGMLAALQQRCAAIAERNRIQTHLCDLQQALPTGIRDQRFDVVAAHFFFDCLHDQQLEMLVSALRPLLQPGAVWVVSEFSIPPGTMRWPAHLLISALYLAFRLLTGLQTRHLPDHRSILERSGFRLRRRASSLGGLLLSELWVGPSDAGMGGSILESSKR